MSLSEGFAWGVSIMVVGSIGLTAFAFWIASTDAKRRAEEEAAAASRAFRESFTIHHR